MSLLKRLLQPKKKHNFGNKTLNLAYHLLQNIHKVHPQFIATDVGKITDAVFWSLPGGYQRNYKHHYLKDAIWSLVVAYNALKRIT